MAFGARTDRGSGPNHMGRTAVSLRYARPRSVLRYFPRAVLGRREALLPEGVAVPRIEGEIAAAGARPSHLRRYREVCGFTDDGCLPLTYPHVMAMPLHIAMLTDKAFVVRLMGLIHLANEIDWHRPLPADRSYRLRSWIEGHEETDRGQEFLLFTELDDGRGVAWAERSRLLARRQGGGAQAGRTVRATLRAPRPPAGAAPGTVDFAASHLSSRRYGYVSGDLNPIHLADFSARWYGFDRAVAHGMWSMARSLAALGPALAERPCTIPVEFKLPLFLPAAVCLEHWREHGRLLFVLRDAGSQRPHLSGAVGDL